MTLSKIVGLVMAIGWVIATFTLGRSWTFAMTVAVGTLLPLALIWFPEFFGSLTGWGTWPVNRPSRFLGSARWVRGFRFEGVVAVCTALLLHK